MESPLPTFQILPCRKKEAKERNLFHIQEPPIGLPMNQIEESLKCLSLNQVAQRESEVATAQPSFNRLAWFNSLIGCMPRLPSFFGKQTITHLTRLLLEFSEDADHKKFLIRLSKDKQVLLGMGITMEIRRGIDYRTCLTKVKRPAKERHLLFHPVNLDLKESRLLVKNLCLGLPKKGGTPRYVKGRVAGGIDRRSAIMLALLATPLPTKSWLFWRLKTCLEESW